MPTVLVTGGAGYIGSAIVIFLAQRDYSVIVIDHATTAPDIIKPYIAAYYASDYAHQDTLHTIFATYAIDAVIHCAAFIEVHESVKNPALYYKNNVIKTHSMLGAMIDHGIKKIIFSSSCAVYGIPEKLPLTEDHPKKPISPYGNTKLCIELMIQDFAHAYDLNYIFLRYFNAAGGLPQFGHFEQHQPESHLIPRIIAACIQQQPCTIYGTDYPTPDGTCMRDYLHIWDLAKAHWKALQYLDAGNKSCALNLGTGVGYSVQQVIDTIQKYISHPIVVAIGRRRIGDPAILVADATMAQHLLKWYPKHSSLEEIIQTALAKDFPFSHFPIIMEENTSIY